MVVNTLKFSWALLTLLSYLHCSASLPLDDKDQQLDRIVLLLPDTVPNNRMVEAESLSLDTLEDLNAQDEGDERSSSSADRPTVYESRITKRHLVPRRLSSHLRAALGKSTSQKRALSIFMALPSMGSSGNLVTNADALNRPVGSQGGRPIRPYGMPLRWG